MRLSAFLREPFKHIELRSPCQACPFSSPEAAPTHCWRSFLAANPISLTGTVPFKSLAPRKISKNDQRNAPEPIRLAGVSSWVLQWLVLVCPLRDSLQGFRGVCLA